MISLAQRVRDFRYSKGWGPDELATRAEISRTALYQIESGKTGLPEPALCDGSPSHSKSPWMICSDTRRFRPVNQLWQ